MRARGPTGRRGLMLGPATRLLWRSPDCLHLELGRRGVLVEGLPVELVRGLAAARRTDDRGPAALDAPAATPPEGTAALDPLVEAGFLWPSAQVSDGDDDRLLPPAPALAGELTALSVLHGEAAGAVLTARARSFVQVAGSSRLTAPIASVLAAAGVGRVHSSVSGAARLWHALPGGVTVEDEARPFAAAAQAAVHRAAPRTDTAPPHPDERPDLTVLVLDTPLSDDRLAALHGSGAPHLAVTVGIDAASVGPLVLPGLTSCLRCADLYRRDRDPAWPALSVQLSVPPRYGPASGAALATLTAGLTALQALAFLDGGEPATLEGSVECELPDWRLRRRSRPAHPACGCMSAR